MRTKSCIRGMRRTELVQLSGMLDKCPPKWAPSHSTSTFCLPLHYSTETTIPGEARDLNVGILVSQVRLGVGPLVSQVRLGVGPLVSQVRLGVGPLYSR